jgi:hypothetical protein
MALEETTPTLAWRMYGQHVEHIEFGDSAKPMLALETPTDDENVYIIEFDVGEHDAPTALQMVVAEVLERKLDPYRVLLAGEIWLQRNEEEGLDEAVGFIYTSRDELEWMAEAPFTRTREGVVWHHDKFSATTTVDDRSPLLDILRGLVGRFE